jgi:hypothetical protein
MTLSAQKAPLDRQPARRCQLGRQPPASWREKRKSAVFWSTASTPAYGPPPPQPASSSSPSFRDVDPIDEGDGPYVKRISADHVGPISEIIAETDKAWCAKTPSGDEAWFAKSVVEHHGEDSLGRGILIVPRWLAKKTQLL